MSYTSGTLSHKTSKLHSGGVKLECKLYKTANNQNKNKHSLDAKSGCYKRPTYCGFTFKNATFWEVPKSGPAALDLDYLTWSNHQETLCYDCKSCKAGILDNVKNDSKKLAAINFCVLIFLSIDHCTGSCAYKGNQDE
ncbi:hypothetical protein IFM89_032110 [Coptis chinensis]|uniref:Uncharacterized protein n=1 Tax=Coptis chinensis TaxID=261450 RepID=A0A835IRI9_9MAGN|nr:hypothetical protein IFM89_032110 [Coptis chinensis]